MMNRIKIDPNYIKAAERGSADSGQLQLVEAITAPRQDAENSPHTCSILAHTPPYSVETSGTLPDINGITKAFGLYLSGLEVCPERLDGLLNMFDFALGFQQMGWEVEPGSRLAQPELPQAIDAAMNEVWTKSQHLPREVRADRMTLALFMLWYTALELYQDRLRCYTGEFDFFSQLIIACTCLSYLEHATHCVRVFAGWEVDDRELFLAQLRKVFNRKIQSLEGQACHCTYCQ